MTFPLSPFAVPSASFPFPVQPPTSDVGGCASLSVTFPSKWLPYILGALQQLTLQATWQGTPEEQGEAEEAAWSLINIFVGAQCPALPPGSMEVVEDMGIRVDCECRVFVTCCDGTEVELLTSKNPNPSQPGAGSKLPAANGGSQKYCFALGPRTAAFAPAVVNTGDTIEIVNPTGAWNDGNSLFWYCPNGYQFILGNCDKVPIQNLGQQLVTSRYMGIIAKIGSVLYDVFNPDANGNPQTFIVPGGVINQPVEFMANFIGPGSSLPSGGVVDFCAIITNNQAGSWRHEFDFTLSQFAWVPHDDGGGPLANYVAGSGFMSVAGVFGPNDSTDEIDSPVISAREITSIEVFYFTDSDHGATGSRLVDTNLGLYGNLNLGAGTFDTLITNDVTGVTQIIIGVDRDTAPTTTNYVISKVIVTGKGTDPF